MYKLSQVAGNVLWVMFKGKIEYKSVEQCGSGALTECISELIACFYNFAA